MICPVCDLSGDFTTKVAICTVPASCRGERLLRHVCSGCDAIFGTQEVLNMTSEEAAEFNFSRYSISAYATREKNNLRHMALLRKLGLKRGDKVLNWGSGPATRLADNARTQFGVEFDNFDPYVHESAFAIRKLEDLGTYDCIVSMDTLEHLLKPVETLGILKRYLKPGGRMVHHTPCYRYEYEYSKMHVVFYLGRSTGVLASKLDMDVKFIDRNTAVFR